MGIRESFFREDLCDALTAKVFCLETFMVYGIYKGDCTQYTRLKLQNAVKLHQWLLTEETLILDPSYSVSKSVWISCTVKYDVYIL